MRTNILFLPLFFLVFLACSGGDDQEEHQMENILGKWQLIETFNSDGGSNPQWKTIENGFTLTLESNGDFTSSKFTECIDGTYTLESNLLKLNYGCEGFTAGIESPEGTFIEEFKFEGANLILKPTYIKCIEGCGYKFERIQE